MAVINRPRDVPLRPRVEPYLLLSVNDGVEGGASTLLWGRLIRSYTRHMLVINRQMLVKLLTLSVVHAYDRSGLDVALGGYAVTRQSVFKLPESDQPRLQQRKPGPVLAALPTRTIIHAR